MCHQLVSSGIPAESFDLRSPFFLTVRSGTLWGYQTPLHNWVAIKVVFWCIMKHGEISLSPSMRLDQEGAWSCQSD
jgi:predicted metalloprotease